MRPALVVGASGAVGRALLRGLGSRGAVVVAWSRSGREEPGVAWQCRELFNDILPDTELIFSAGPIDGLVSAFSRSGSCTPRLVVALSSSSAVFKRGSTDESERAVAARLQGSEDSLQELCRARGARCVVLRPTLIYGGDDVGHFGAVAGLARRLGFVVLPGAAHGLRMPIHADDLAATMLNALDHSGAQGVFNVGGGEILPYDAMLERALRSRAPSARVLRIPDAIFRLALGGAHRVGALHGLSAAMVARMREDLVVDDSEARRTLGHAPGPFRPGAG